MTSSPMPSTSPGDGIPTFDQILPGAPNDCLQTLTSFLYRHERFITYVSGSQLNILSAPNVLVKVVPFDETLVAVSAHRDSGKIAVAGRKRLYLLEPVTRGWSKIWWEKKLLLKFEDPEEEVQCLNWSQDDELLVGGSRHLILFSTTPSSRNNTPPVTAIDGEKIEERRPLWSKSLASPVRHAVFNTDADLIASCGRYDRLVKLWRRLSFEEGLFDYSYLPHPAAVTHLQWRVPDAFAEERHGSGIGGRPEDDLEVLYTIASDGVLRVWRSGGMLDADILTLYTEVDLVAAIPQSPSLRRTSQSSRSPPRFVFILSPNQLNAAVLAATGRNISGKLSHSLEHLKEICSNSPDVIVSIDGRGRMSAWGLQSIGHKRRPETPTMGNAFHITQTEGLPLKLSTASNARFEVWLDDDRLHLLSRTFDGKCSWWQGDAESFFSHAVLGSERLRVAGEWSGQHAPVLGVRSSCSGKHAVSWDEHGGIGIWDRSPSDKLTLRSTLRQSERILDAASWQDFGYVFTLHNELIKVWNVTTYEQEGEVAHGLSASAKPGLYSFAGEQIQDSFLVLVDDACGHRYVRFGGRGSDLAVSELQMTDRETKSIRSAAITAGVGKYRIVSVDADGVLHCSEQSSSKIPKHASSVGSTSIAAFRTGIENVTKVAAFGDHVALVSSDQRRLAIFDLMEGYREHEQSYLNAVTAARWYSSSGGLALAVASGDAVEVLIRSHYQNLNSWIRVKQLSISELGIPLSGIEWLGDGNLAVVAGNGLLLPNTNIHLPEIPALPGSKIIALSTLASTTQLPLPVWHPRVLQQLVQHGHAVGACAILRRLVEKLRFWSEGDHLPWLLDLSPDEVLHPSETYTLDDEVVRELADHLAGKNLPSLSTDDQTGLHSTADAIMFLTRHMSGLDTCATSYLFSWKLQILELERQERVNGEIQVKGTQNAQKQVLVPEMGWREITLAYHSATQQSLWDLLIIHYDNKMTWSIARRLGVTVWLADREALAQVFEALAQSAYRSTDPPDPTNASLYFLALNKKATLVSLWRIASGHNEQKMTQNFLKRDFTQPSAQTAAKKNAYALMGRRRFEYAAAFFLLAGDGPSAVSLLAGQCEDVMLAVAVARLYSGPGSSSALPKLLENGLLNQAQEEGNRWLMSWCYSILDRKGEAADALIRPLQGVRTWQQDDPMCLLLYKLLRNDGSPHEYQAVIRSSRILRRQGLWVLALETTLYWQFNFIRNGSTIQSNHTAAVAAVQEAPSSLVAEFNSEKPTAMEPPSMLDDFNAPATTAAQDDKAAREAKAAELLKKLKANKNGREKPAIKTEAKREPTQFQEPDANSLLDSFGF